MLPLKNLLTPERVMLTSGPVEVLKFSLKFRSWTGEPVDSYSGEAVVDCEGSPAFAELALIPYLQQLGATGAVWVDSYRRRFRNAMPQAFCELPTRVRDVYDRIVKINGRCGGCWDILAWHSDGVMFIECKRKKKDRTRPSQAKWLESALMAGLRIENFAISSGR